MNNFEPNALIKECINNRDLKGLRGALTTIIYRDRNFSTGDFDNSVDYTINKCQIKEVYQPFDKMEPLFNDSIKSRMFTEENFGDAIYELKVNFCKERIDDVKIIGKELYPVKSEKDSERNFTQSTAVNTGKKQQSYNSKSSPIKKNGVDAVTIVKGVAVLAVVAVAISIIAKSLK